MWYSFTPSSSATVDSNDGSVYGLQSQLVVNVTAGTTYFVAAGTCCGGAPGQIGLGGTLVFNAGSPRRP